MSAWRQTDRQTGRQKGRQADRQTDTDTDTDTDTHRDTHRDTHTHVVFTHRRTYAPIIMHLEKYISLHEYIYI